MARMPIPLRRANVYMAENRPAIFAAMHFNSAGICYEQENPLVQQAADQGALSALLRTSLAQFSFLAANLRDRKSADWPSYKASRCRSIREFESQYTCIGVTAVNEAELFYDASCQPHGEHDIKLHVTLNRHAEDGEIDRLLNKLFHACRRWIAD
jgi:hypothetical protein